MKILPSRGIILSTTFILTFASAVPTDQNATDNVATSDLKHSQCHIHFRINSSGDMIEVDFDGPTGFMKTDHDKGSYVQPSYGSGWRKRDYDEDRLSIPQPMNTDTGASFQVAGFQPGHFWTFKGRYDQPEFIVAQYKPDPSWGVSYNFRINTDPNIPEKRAIGNPSCVAWGKADRTRRSCDCRLDCAHTAY